MRFRGLIVCVLLSAPAFTIAPAFQDSQPGATTANPSGQPNPNSHPTLLIIPHTHWEGAVFETREEYLEEGLPHIAQALDLLRAFPDYRFVLDQAAYVKPFLERYPDRVAAFRSFVSQGRLEIV